MNSSLFVCRLCLLQYPETECKVIDTEFEISQKVHKYLNVVVSNFINQRKKI